jgi:hypothetical protein
VQDDDDNEDDPLNKYNFWRSFRAQVKALRDDMSSGKTYHAASGTQEGVHAAYEALVPMLDAMKHGRQPQEQASDFPNTNCRGVDIYDMAMFSGSYVGPGNEFGHFNAPGMHTKVPDARGVTWFPHPK